MAKAADSKRRECLVGLMTNAKRKNNKVKILGMSATPLVNKLKEGKSILELITGKVFHDLKTAPYVSNAVALFEKFTNMSLRQIVDYKKSKLLYTDVEAELPDEKLFPYLEKNPLGIEQLLTDVRIPEIIKRIEGQTIIYTEYVGSRIPGRDTIVNKLAKAVRDAGYKYGFYTGENDTGLIPFKKGKIQVLIASRPISVGIDGLQDICNNLIFNTLP
ncbi:MAG: hypothetical protein IH949_06200, partial [Bacteroidetes bacterium]|nr:hypothetical protein [Bacteroidota bacterium]